MTEHTNGADHERRDAPDDPSVAAAAEEYQIVDLPEVDEEREVDERVEDPEAPLVDAGDVDEDAGPDADEDGVL
ncbi:hypothetical protein [Herbiconiux sp. L3-i23]|uniref:hypothetical protein n=1 Tax=Herbiconiux sp. L3-i23 TaxID=2905871 RepID=UPI002069E650|nr:hypothetical protein [Herbiconiux sp. L3-i23]BDI21720.1 hypothetical protein L3i23_04960 [Herbiconiux sp. L3-i23]